MAEVLFAVSCFPADCLTNRAWVMSLGVLPDSVPWPLPYGGSTKGECQRHNGPIWIGPEQQKLIAGIKEKGGSPLIICHICSLIMADEIGASVDMVSLSNKTTIVPRNN
jgi:hypothetical protein